MSDSLYTYAVARIRSKELTLLNAQAIDQLLAAKSYDECLRLLADRGWGDGEVAADDARLLAAEREKTWNLIGELVEDMSVFDVFLYANDYHNLKAAIKLVCTGESDFGVFISHGTVDSGAILEAVRAKEFGALPEAMRAPAEEAYNALQGRSRQKQPPRQEQFEPLTTAPFVSVPSRIIHVLRGLMTGRVRRLRQLFVKEGGRSQTVATFLAVLELVRAGRIAIADDESLTVRTGRKM